MHHDVSLTDDQNIRKDLFFASSNLLKKIRQLEKDHTDFLLWDQILYQDWYNLTFRDELQAGELLEKRHKVLSTFQVHLKYVANTSNVPLERAYCMLKEEESQYQAGDDVWKFVIDKLRKNRFDTATRSSAVAGEPLPIPEDGPAINFAEIFFKDDSALSGLRRRARSVYHYLNDIDDGMMARHLSVPMAGYQLFKETFQIAMKCGDWKLLGRLWKAADPAYQQRYLRNMPVHLKDFLQQIIAENASEEALEKEQAEAESLLRTTYRKLARLLHPDKQIGVSKEHQDWASIKWQRVQAAYKAQDHDALKRIELLCMAELGQLNDLTTDEIYQSSLVLNEEYEALKRNLKACRKHPAWKFSSRRSYETLKKQARLELEKRFGPLEAEVHMLESLLKMLSAAEKQAVH
ncbi:hypothetical protein Bb109J_c0826 [Bdellovibrio bacteriovorus]|uniref:hypothetical protein n=1 Tax=Bdellovibrio bacteriovorus TaxID=959 RepID=UPI00045BEDAC|nr:hypothetical protein [Bdellovibrio bacteriovorus]AHZ86170.1 hypothetical protein EP01_14690 [Bdellovibrio bacteriovorus]BEV67406.1 hypothetical protein Bb109J_c0826 [Bdellovibrio bacteriovorus]